VSHRQRATIAGRCGVSPRAACLTALALAVLSSPAAAAAAKITRPFAWDIPIYFPLPVVPADNPMSWEKVELGRFLFYDTRLSGNQTFACASCHQQDKAFTDGRPQAVGSTGEAHPRGSMSLANIAYAPTLGWANDILLELEDQALVPMFGEFPVELGLSGLEDVLLERLRNTPLYQRLFAEAFPDDADPFSLGNLVKAIAAFERTLISGDSPVDRFTFGLDDAALSPSARRGLSMFFTEKFECFHCHEGFNFAFSRTANNAGSFEKPFLNNGLYNLRCSDFALPPVDLIYDINGDPVVVRSDFGCYPPSNPGLFAVSTLPAHMGAFKPPSLRNICATAPYMHDGSIATLDDVLDHYAAAGRTIAGGPYAGDGSSSPLKAAFIPGFDLSAGEREDLLHFLCGLTDESFLSNEKFADPFAAVDCPGDCDFDGRVTVTELIRQVNAALDQATLANCVAADDDHNGALGVNELVGSVGRALRGCTAP